MKLNAAKNPCITCGMQISWDNAAREKLNWRGPLNLDGTTHRHNENTVIAPQQLEQIREQNTEKVSPPVSSQQSAIQQAHEENMKSGEELRSSIDGLTVQLGEFKDAIKSVEVTLLLLNETIKAYLDLPK